MADTTKQKNQKEFTVIAGYAYYSFVHAPQKDEKYGDKYKVDVMVEEEDGSPVVYTNPLTGESVDMVKKIKELGVSLRDANNVIPGRYLSIRSKAEFTVKNPKTGKKEIVEREPIPVAYADKTPLDSSTLIGNGSKVRVQASVKRWVDEKGEDVVSLYLERVIVDELVPYTNSVSTEEFDFPHMRKSKKEEGNEDVPFEE